MVPPYGDAHEHNFDGLAQTKSVARQHLLDGIFYAQGMTDTTDGAAAVIAAGLVDTPQTPDVTYAHGGLTGVNGHPKEVYESLANGFYYPQTDAAASACDWRPQGRGQGLLGDRERRGAAGGPANRARGRVRASTSSIFPHLPSDSAVI